jgi:hypothetical protein
MPYLRPLQEYRHAEWPLDGPFFFLLAGLGLAWLLPRLFPRLPRLLPGRVLLPGAVLGVLGALRIRFVAEFAMLAGPALAVAATRAVAPRVWRWQRPVAGALLVGLALGPRVAAVAAGGRAVDLGLLPDLVPGAAIDFVEQHGLRARMYNDLEVGSYLCWRGWPRYRVFQDPRINGYPDDFHAFLRRTDLSRPAWQGFLDRFGVTAALITFPTQNPRGALFDPALWALVYRERDGLVFARRPLRDGLREIPLTFVYAASADSGELSPVPLPEPPAGAVVSPCEWQRGLGDFHRQAKAYPAALFAYQAALDDRANPACVAEARVAAGTLALQLGDADEAARLLAGAGAAAARTNRGFALLKLGRAGEALAEFEVVLGSNPRNDEATFGRGLGLAALGRYREAVAAFDRLLARSPQHLSAAAARRERARLRGLLGEP